MKIWLDDLRDPVIFGENFDVPTRAVKVLMAHGREGWVWVKTVEAAQDLLERGNVDVLSCDNDLGAGLTEGYKLLDWLEEKTFSMPDFQIPKYIYVHSDDMAKLNAMQQAIAGIKRFDERNKQK